MNPTIEQLLSQLKRNPVFAPKFCENCGARHASNDLMFIGQQEGVLLFQIACSNCSLAYIVKLHPTAMGIAAQKLEANVDISSSAELKKFAGSRKVGKDEALQVYLDIKDIKTLDQFLALMQPDTSNRTRHTINQG